jgi:hypothetical protein
MNVQLQDWIHKFEVGSGSRLVRRVMILSILVTLAVFYDLAAFRNLATPEGMDAAQLARNLADGKGFTTYFVRPLSLHLVYDRATNALARTQSESQHPALDSSTPTTQEQLWARRLQVRHPDLANAPLYPLILAGILKCNPFGYPDLKVGETFAIYRPDLWIAMFNQALLFLAAWFIFGLALRMFDEAVAWVAVVLFLGSDLMWRFSLSGLPTPLLMVWFLILFRFLWALDTSARATSSKFGRMAWLAALTGVVVALGGLTRYSFAWLMIPVLALLATLPHPKRVSLAVIAGAVFLVIFTPWLVRNVQLSGKPFGTAGYALFQGTSSFPKDQLERSSNPDFREFSITELRDKLVKNTRDILRGDLPRMGGSWAAAFFLVGLLVPFRNPSLGRLRSYYLGCLGTVILVQALGQTHTGEDPSQVHADNLLVAVSPALFLFGVSFFFNLLDQFGQKFLSYRYLTLGLFCLLLNAPLLLAFVPPHPSPVVYPPYFPPWIQEKSRFMGERDLMMSDIPWAVAWYGGKPSVWLSLYYRDPFAGRYRNDFFEIHDRMKHISALYCTSKTLKTVETDSLWSWVSRSDPNANWEDVIKEWPAFVLVGIYLHSEVPRGFPLRNAPEGIFPELFLTDSEHMAEKTIQSP